jgi:hypothetical protein
VGSPLVLVAGFPEVAVAVAGLLALGIGYSLIETANLSLLQRLTSDDVLGRAFAVLESSYWLTTGLGAITPPLIVGLLGLRGALVAFGCLLPLIAALRWAQLARLEAGAAIPDRNGHGPHGGPGLRTRPRRLPDGSGRPQVLRANARHARDRAHRTRSGHTSCLTPST